VLLEASCKSTDTPCPHVIVWSCPVAACHCSLQHKILHFISHTRVTVQYHFTLNLLNTQFTCRRHFRAQKIYEAFSMPQRNEYVSLNRITSLRLYWFLLPPCKPHPHQTHIQSKVILFFTLSPAKSSP